MSKIGFLGLGAMGRRMAARLIDAGHEVRLWNRSAAAAAELRALGATLAQTPRDAATGADVVIAMVRDDSASHAIWLDAGQGALAGLSGQAIAIESSTLSMAAVTALSDAMRAGGHRFIEAPVLGTLPQAEAGQLIHLIGGAAADVAAGGPVLSAMGARQLYAGPVGSGMALKLVANTAFGVQVAMIAELLGRMAQLGLDPMAAMELLAETPLLSPAARNAAGLMIAAKDEPMFPVALVAKDFGYAIDGDRAAMPLAAAALGQYERAIALGLGDRNLTAVARLLAPAAQPV